MHPAAKQLCNHVDEAQCINCMVSALHGTVYLRSGDAGAWCSAVRAQQTSYAMQMEDNRNRHL